MIEIEPNEHPPPKARGFYGTMFCLAHLFFNNDVLLAHLERQGPRARQC